MSIKTILLPLRESPMTEHLLATGLYAARRFQAHLDVLHIMPNPEELLPYATLGLSTRMKASVTEAARKSAEETAAKLRAQFESGCKHHKVPIRERGEGPGESSAGWIQVSGRRDLVVGRTGRLADLLIVPRPSRATPPPRTFEAALRDTGKAVLVVPPDAPEEVRGERIVIAWNGSKEAAGAVAAAGPYLTAAESVTVLCSEKRMRKRPNGDDVVKYLACHGVSAKLQIFDSTGLHVGASLLSQAEHLGSNLFVCGGHSRGRFQEMITGGVTGHLLDHAHIPVLMAH